MTHPTIYSRFKEQALKYPDSASVVTDGRRITYSALDQMANAIMARLDIRPATAVGIVMSHGPEMVAAMLAVLKSGGVYVPAEPSLPPDRTRYMMETAGVTVTIDDDFCRDLPAEAPDFPDRSRPDMPAYILFTSGTSGRPKGVVVENHSVVNYAEAFEREFHTRPGDVMVQYSVCSFDIFVEEVFTTLLNGATLAIPGPDVTKISTAQLLDFATRCGATEISGFPYLLAEINRHGSLPPTLRLLISGGDVLRASYISRLRDSGVAIYNTYGPSETTVCASYFRCDNAEPLPDGTYPIGKEVKGVGITIRDSHLRPVPDGEVGEICITGEGVSDGYIGNPPEQSNFATLPSGERIYRSGDLGRRLPDGNLAFLHRADKQVMIMGKRVEPDEVENVLNTFPEVETAVVRPFADDRGLSYLVAYFVPKSAKCTLKAVRKWLGDKLADFMIPEYFVAMQEIPLTVRGKVDRNALPKVLRNDADEL